MKSRVRNVDGQVVPDRSGDGLLSSDEWRTVAHDDVVDNRSADMSVNTACADALEVHQVVSRQRAAVIREFLSDVRPLEENLSGDVHELHDYLRGRLGLYKRPEQHVLYFLYFLYFTGHCKVVQPVRQSDGHLIVHKYTIEYYCHYIVPIVTVRCTVLQIFVLLQFSFTRSVITLSHISSCPDITSSFCCTIILQSYYNALFHHELHIS